MRLRFIAAILQLLLPVVAAHAADFPEHGRPITIIVPYAPGGATDTGARLMAAALEPLLNTSVEVVNRAGAASQVGLTQLVRAKPDGYTLSYVVVPTVITHYLDPARHAIYTRESFQPIGLHFLSPAMLAVQSDSPYRTLKDLVEAARAHPGAISVSDSGLMGVPNLCTMMLGAAAGVQFTPVHFDGGAPSITALLGNHVQVLAGGTVDGAPYRKTGQFRILGVSDEQPDWSMPDVPTMKSQGYDVIAVSNTGMVAPAGTPPAVVAVLTNAMKTVIASPEHQQKIKALSLTPTYLDPAVYTKTWIDYENRVKTILPTLLDALMPGRRRDILSGGICIVAGIGAFVEANSYTIGSLAKLGPGFYPAVLGVLLTLTGFFIIGAALVFAPAKEDPDPMLTGAPDWRGGFCIIAGAALFILAAWLCGLAPAIFFCVFIAALGDRTATVRGSLGLALGITVFGTILFGYLLKISMPLWQWPG